MSDSTQNAAPPARARLASSGALFVWAARVMWLAVAVAGGAGVGGALENHSRAVQVVGTVGAWLGWGVGAVALALTGVATLTAVRVVVPGALMVSAVAVTSGIAAGPAIAIVAPSIAAFALVSAAEFGRSYIQASAYGDELRFGLRAPFGYLVPSVVSWLLVAGAIVAVPLAWASRAWVLAVVSTVVVVLGLWLLPRRWHQLSRRWFVLVPAGAVVHDPVVLADTLMMPRATVASMALDPDGAARRRAADLTGPTPGVGVEIRLTESTTAVFAATPRQRNGRAIHLEALVITPTRPGAVLVAARNRGLPA